MRKGIFIVIIWELILSILFLTLNLYVGKKQQEEREIREQIELHNQGEEIRTKLAEFIMVQKYKETWDESSKYEYNYYLFAADTIKFIPESIDKLGEEEYEKIKKAVTIFSDEDIEEMRINRFDMFERGGIIFSILEYNYDDQTGIFHNKEAILNLCPGIRIFNYKDVVENIPIRLVNKYSLEKYDATYQEILDAEEEAYRDLTSKVRDLYYEVIKGEQPENFNYDWIFSNYHGKYHSGVAGYILEEYEELPEHLKARPEVQEVYEKYAVMKAEYDAKPEVQKFNDCVQKEQEYKQKIWNFNLQNPELINGICKEIISQHIETFDSKKLFSYIRSSDEFEKLIDTYLKKKEFSALR